MTLDAPAEHPEAVRAVVRAGVPVWAQFGITPHTAARYGGLPPCGAGAAGAPAVKAAEELVAARKDAYAKRNNRRDLDAL